MSAQVDISRAIRSWLREEDHDTADEVLEVVLSQLATTPQRRRFWQAGRPSAPWTMIRVIAVAVAVLIAVVTYSLLPGLRVGPGATPSVVPTLIARGSFVEHDWGQVDFEATRVGASVTGRMTIAAREDVGAVTIDFECAREGDSGIVMIGGDVATGNQFVAVGSPAWIVLQRGEPNLASVGTVNPNEARPDCLANLDWFLGSTGGLYRPTSILGGSFEFGP